MKQKRTSKQQARKRWRGSLVIVPAALLALGAVGFVTMLERAQVAPRQLGPYLERRASGHNPAIEKAGRWLGHALVELDRAGSDVSLQSLRLGAQDAPAGSEGTGRSVPVASVGELGHALANAQPGDTITLAPGRYQVSAPLDARVPGSASMPITVRARRPGNVVLEQNSVEGIRVSAPHWRFENLTIRGVCDNDSYCEHAFHITGDAHHVAFVNNYLVDFNAHIKINGSGGKFPDHGLIEANTLTNTRARVTPNPVTPIDIVTASDWIIRRNLISDFIKDGGNNVSYGAFAKGGGERNVFEQNLVWCERKLTGYPGQRIGLSFGGGSTNKQYCRVRDCIVEQQGGTLRNNLIASCSDAGIYLNNAAQTTILHNSVIDTAGIDVRFPSSSADLEGNLIDGTVRSRNGGIVREVDNRSAEPFFAYLGYHPVRALYETPLIDWRGAALRRDLAGPVPPDLCGQARGARPAYGAFESFRPCIATSSSRSLN